MFALGAITLALSQYVLPETLYPWLNLVSGLLVVVVGVAVLRSHLRRRRAVTRARPRTTITTTPRPRLTTTVTTTTTRPPARARGARGAVANQLGGHHHHDHDHDHGHSHLPQEPGMRGLLAMGAAAGLIPCPSALVVLLGAVAQGQIALGMLLIVAFSAGLAVTLTALGLAVVLASRALAPRARLRARWSPRCRPRRRC